MKNVKRRPFLLPSFVLLFGRKETTPKENVEVAPSAGTICKLLKDSMIFNKNHRISVPLLSIENFSLFLKYFSILKMR